MNSQTLPIVAPASTSEAAVGRRALATKRRPKGMGAMVVASCFVLCASPGLVDTYAFDLQNIIGTQTEFVRQEARADSGEFDPSSALRSTPPVVAGTYAFDLQNIVGTQTQMIRHEATEYQRKVAEARARAYVAQLRVKAGAAPSKSAKTGTTPPKGKKTDAQTAAVAAANIPRYIAVETAKDKRSPAGTTPVMVWDTRSESLVNNSIYDVSNPPPVGGTEKFDTYSAQYIGPGVANR